MARHAFKTLLLTASLVALSGCQTQARPAVSTAAPLAPAPAAAMPAGPRPATIRQLVDAVSVPHQSFTMANGLRVLVHEDHKAPVVGFGVWYNVGSKDEPNGQTGFAHLFEHLMFYGSENVREGILPYLQEMGASDSNGSTWFDRTNYYETVPKTNLPRALFMESDRMGYLLGAVDQKRLDAQRAVVKNEKRERDNKPKGPLDQIVYDALFPEGHPYRHDTIGSMEDLDAASLATVQNWFIDRYGPNNAIVALSGDITLPEAKALMETYFGAIPAGKVNVPAAAEVPTLAAPKSILYKDNVPGIEIQRNWVVPGIASPQLGALAIGTQVLGGLASSRFDRVLVREEKLATAASASLTPFHRIGQIEISVTVKPGVDPALVERRLDALLADYLANGPTQDEIDRAATQAIAGRIRGLESVSTKNELLAEGLLYNGDSDFYKKRIEAYARLTPDEVRTAMNQWLSRPAVNVRIEPGPRADYVESKGPSAKSRVPSQYRAKATPRVMPPLGDTPAIDFPAVSHVTLSNGIRLDYAQRSDTPLTRVALAFDAGVSADDPARRGLQNMTMTLLGEGSETMTSQEFAEAKERLGAQLSASGSADRSSVTLSALSPNLRPSLALMADMVRRPAFRSEDVERVRGQLVEAIKRAKVNPNAMAQSEYFRQLYGAEHGYGGTALGEVGTVQAAGAADFAAFRERWLRPDNARLFVVSDRPLAEVRAALEDAFGDWQAPAVAKGVKSFPALPPVAPTGPRIVFVDRPSSPQSVIWSGQVTPLDPKGDPTADGIATDVYATGSSGRVFQTIREEKGWGYSPYGFTIRFEKSVPFANVTAVQADRTGDTIAELLKITRDIQSTRPISDKELAISVGGAIRGLPGEYESGSAVLATMMSNAMFGRPDDYAETLGARLKAVDLAAANAKVKAQVNPDAFVFVVVGDAKTVMPQLRKLGYPIETVAAR